MIEELKSVLINKYNPIAIILHGSRARGEAFINSDCDLYLIVSDDFVLEDTCDSYSDVYLDIEFIKLEELKDVDINQKFGFNLAFTKIILDRDNIAKDLITKAEDYYKKGKNLNNEQLKNRKDYFTRGVLRLENLVNNRIAFTVRFNDIYARIPRYYFELKQNSWGRSPILAEKQIKDLDTWLYEKLNLLLAVENTEKVKILKEIQKYFFD